MNLITKECKFSTDACCWWQNNILKKNKKTPWP